MKIIPITNAKKKTLSDHTKKKIAENNKKFSICKLCKKQCKGFRGLVDHMHNDHSDYKPWQCNYCDVKTSFVKTLYRHLKQVHKVSLYYLHTYLRTLHYIACLLSDTCIFCKDMWVSILCSILTVITLS